MNPWTYLDIRVVVPVCDPCCWTDEHKPFPIVFGPDWLEGYKTLGLVIGLSRNQIATVARALRNGSWLPTCWQCGSTIDLHSEEGFHIRHVSLSEYFNLEQIRNISDILNPPKNPGDHTRKFIYKVFGGKCVVCQGEATTLDHIIPRAKGGLAELTNLQPMCRKCNQEKANQDVEIVPVYLTFRLRP